MTVRLSDPRRFQSSTVGVGHLRAEKPVFLLMPFLMDEYGHIVNQVRGK